MYDFCAVHDIYQQELNLGSILELATPRNSKAAPKKVDWSQLMMQLHEHEWFLVHALPLVEPCYIQLQPKQGALNRTIVKGILNSPNI